MLNVTIFNSGKGEPTFSRVELDEFVRRLGNGTYRQTYVSEFKKEVCFAAVWQKQGGKPSMKCINQLVLLSLENLHDMETAEEYKQQAALQPYTLLCFLGHDGHSLHIVCRYEVTKGPASETTQSNAFRLLHYIYSSQLGTQVADHEPDFRTRCKVSYDPKPYYNPEAMPVTVSAQQENTPGFKSKQEEISDYNNPQEIPGVDLRTSWMRRFHDCLNTAIEACRDIDDEDLFQAAVLEQLADGCRQMGLPQVWAADHSTYIPLLGGVANREMIRDVFHTAYLKETLKTIPLKFTRPSALLIYKTEAYMKENYSLRLNVMTGTPEYRKKGSGFGFMPLNQAARNTMTINALKAGLDSWDRDLDRYIDSDLIPKYEPLDDYISHLPRWDHRHDYVGDMARRVKTDRPHWENDFHIWMLSMVAQWIGKNRQYGNAIVPLLIGPQGIGKTVFCRRLLPPHLQTYFNDKISMKNDNDIFLAMSSYALINIDEFDTMSKSQQPLLKYLLSKHDVKFRPPYGKAMQQRKRFASFIATTNNLRPLTDPSGSRRFVCVPTDKIDNTDSIPYDQLYAQLYQELREGRRYWFDEEDNNRITRQNQDFQKVYDYRRMIELTYLPVEKTPEDAKFVLVKDIMRRLEELFPTFIVRKNTDSELGKKIKEMGYECHRHTNGVTYRMKEI